jgi:RNA polymerase sigma-70 factor (ECF subfamily)
MNDERIIEMYCSRDEQALKETQEKYESFCNTVAANILAIREDREECMNDVLLALWNSIPPERPHSLKAYIAKITRRIALNRTRAENRWKRCANYTAVGEEFLSSVNDGRDLAELFEAARAGRIINEFLETLPGHEREVFLLRYYFGETVAAVAEDMGFTVGKVKSILMRTRERLASRLGEEGIIV